MRVSVTGNLVWVACPDCGAPRQVTEKIRRRWAMLGKPHRCRTCAAPKPASVAKTARVCRHCDQRPVNRPRGLCWGFFHKPGVKELYPSTSKYARRGAPNFLRPAPLPEPTCAEPGTPDKVAVLELRALRGEQLFHPRDAKTRAAA